MTLDEHVKRASRLTPLEQGLRSALQQALAQWAFYAAERNGSDVETDTTHEGAFYRSCLMALAEAERVEATRAKED